MNIALLLYLSLVTTVFWLNDLDLFLYNNVLSTFIILSCKGQIKPHLILLKTILKRLTIFCAHNCFNLPLIRPNYTHSVEYFPLTYFQTKTFCLKPYLYQSKVVMWIFINVLHVLMLVCLKRIFKNASKLLGTSPGSVFVYVFPLSIKGSALQEFTSFYQFSLNSVQNSFLQ